jgi:S1-C subfamily serine protease
LKSLLVGLVVLLGLGVMSAGLVLGYRALIRADRDMPAATNPDVKPKVVVANSPLDSEEVEANTLFESDKESVVNVDTVALTRGVFDDQTTEHQTGTGSGFVWDSDGRIVTNYHVVEEALKRTDRSIRVVLAERSRYDARIVGAAPDFDLAVVQIAAPKEKLKPISLADSSELKVGQKVFAIGNPFGLSLTLTTGIISNLDRMIESPSGTPIPKSIQHTAQINPGNSGGPLLNRSGKLIGVNTSIASPSGGNVGIGFSIPSNTVNQVVTEIIKTGRTARVDFGVRLYDQKKLRRAGYENGVMIAEVIPGGVAARAGLRGLRQNPTSGRAEPGDIILAINGQLVDGVDEFQAIVTRLTPGSRVTVRFLRGEDEREITVTV